MDVIVYFVIALTLVETTFADGHGDDPNFTSDANVNFKENQPVGSVIVNITTEPALDADHEVKITNGTCVGPNNAACGAGTNVSAMFNLNKHTGALTNAKVIDYEKFTKFTLTLWFHDSIGNNATQMLTINIQDVNEEPVFNTSSLMASFSEKKMEETVLLTVKATDPEGAVVTFKNGTPTSEMLTIVSNGTVIVSKGKTLEVPASCDKTYLIGVMAESGDPKKTSNATVTIAMTAPCNASSMIAGSLLAIVSLFALIL